MRKQALLAALLVVVSSSSLQAYSIDGVTFSPAGEINSTDQVQIDILITTPSAAAFLTQSTAVILNGNDVQIVIYIDSGIYDTLDTLVETVNLGALQSGVYNYSIHLEAPHVTGWGTPDVSGDFTVLAGDMCSLSIDVGECDGICPRYYFDSATSQCELFNYGCCGGNANNFETYEQCENTCMEIASQGDAPIPAVSSWGMIIVALLLLNAGSILLKNKHAVFHTRGS